MSIVALIGLVLAIWIAVYLFVIRPKLLAFRFTAGIDHALERIESGWVVKARLWIKGLKVMILGIVTSMIPFAGVLYTQLVGLDWTLFVSTDKAKLIVAVIGLVGVLGPMLMAILHSGALAEASAAEPVQPTRPASVVKV